MKQHLTEEILIKYEFKLLSEGEMAQAAEHLSGCQACSKQHKQVQGKFAALDTLREEPKASESLIASTLQQVNKSKTVRKVGFYQRGWLQVAAAVLVVGGLVFSVWRAGPYQQNQKDTQLERNQPEQDRVVVIAPGERNEGQFNSETGDDEQPAMAIEDAPQPRMGIMATADTERFIPEEPPFAPASNIELTVLPRRENVQLTIYNSADLTLVRDKRSLTMKRGWNWLQFSWEGTLIDPTSLNLEPKGQGDKITVEQLVFPPRWKNLGRWLIKSEVSGPVDFEITYLTSGIDWRAFYMGTLSQDEATMRLQGYVRVNNNSGENYENAQTRLLVGQVHLLDEIAELARREQPYGSPIPVLDLSLDSTALIGHWKMDIDVNYSMLDLKRAFTIESYGIELPKEIIKEGLSEYFLYTIEGTETIENEWGKRLPSFEVDEIPVESLYKYDEEHWARQTMRFMTFVNDEEHELGETPIPNGAVKIYGTADAVGHLKYVGGTNIKYIPVNEEAELNLGVAREVQVELVRMESRTENYEFKIDNDIETEYFNIEVKDEVSGSEKVVTWRVKVTNSRTIPVDVEITRWFGDYWQMEEIAGEVAAEKLDAWRERFEMRVEPQSKREFTYTVRYYYGTRERFSREPM